MARTRRAGAQEKKHLHPPKSVPVDISPIAAEISTSSHSSTSIDRAANEPEIHGKPTPGTRRPVSKTTRSTWDAFTRYFSEDKSSFPDYGTPQVNMKDHLVRYNHLWLPETPPDAKKKRINAGGGGPRNTMSGQSRTDLRTTATLPVQSTPRPKKRPKELASPSFVIELASSRSSSIRADNTGSSEGLGVMGRISSVAKAHAKQNGGAAKDFSSAPFPKARRTDRAVESIEDGPDASAQANETRKRVRRSISPDVIALNNTSDEPPPANITSDLRNRKRPKLSGLIFQKEDKMAKRANGRALDDIDELQAGPPKKRKRSPELISDEEFAGPSSRGALKSTYFTSPKNRSKTSDAPFLHVLKAASGNFCYEEDQGQRNRVFLRTDPEHPRSFLAVDEKGRRRGDVPWMNVNVDKAIAVSKADSPHAHINRPMTQLQPPSLSIEFADVSEAAYFTDRAKASIQKILEVPKLKDIVDKAVLRATGRPDQQPATALTPDQEKGPHSGDKSPSRLCAPHSPTQAEPRVKDERRGVKLKDQMAVANTTTATRRASAQQPPRSPGLGTRRTRSSLPLIPVEDDFVRWTALHPDWKKDWHQSLIWPPTGKNRTTVDEPDIYRLDEGEFLNDNLINFWLRQLQHQLETQNPDLLKRVYFFSTFFFEKLKYNNGKIDYSGVRSWTAKVDVFSYDYLIVPVNENAHWYLAIICNPGKVLPKDHTKETEGCTVGTSPQTADSIEQRLSEVSIAEGTAHTRETPVSLEFDEDVDSREGVPRAVTKRKRGSVKAKPDAGEPRIVTLDSLGSGHPRTVAALKVYLVEEAKDKQQMTDVMPPLGMKAKSIPQQDNWCDCGIYVLAYVREFLNAPDETLRRILQKEPTGWKVNASEERKSIRQLIFTLQRRQHATLEKERAEKAARRQAKRKEAAALHGKAKLTSRVSEGDIVEATGADHDLGAKPSTEGRSSSQGGSAEASQPATSVPASPAVSGKGETSKDTSSTNSFHTANSSPSLVASAGSDRTSRAETKNDDPVILAEDTILEINGKVNMVQGLSSSPTSDEQDGITTPHSHEPGKRKTRNDDESSGATPQGPRKLSGAELQAAPKKSIEVEDDDDDDESPGHGVQYDGIDREETAD